MIGYIVIIAWVGACIVKIVLAVKEAHRESR